MPSLYHVVAMARSRVIGRNNELPWPRLTSDLKFFKELTMNHTVIMGRKTFESIAQATKGKMLPGRDMIYVTRHPSANVLYGPPGGKCFDSLEQALKPENWQSRDAAFIIGGAELYRQTLEDVDGIYLTWIDADYEGDAFYPEIPDFFREKSRRLLQDNPRVEAVYYENTRKAVSHA